MICFNKPSQKVLLKNKFNLEGRRVKQLYISGNKRVDELIYGKLI